MPESTPLTLSIEGMHCGGCVNRVSQALGKVPGVTVDQVEVGSARLRFDPSATNPASIAEAVTRIGFTAKAAC
jgi:copper chaperone